MQFDEIITALGAFGPFKRRILLLGAFPSLLYSFHNMIPVFILAEHSHTCDSHDGLNSSSIKPSLTSSIPMPHQSCHIGYYDNVTNSTSEHECKSWSFDTKELTSTPISDFQLVCGDAIMKSHINMAFFLGVVISFLVVAAVGDSLGRRPVACGILMFLCFGIGCAWSPNVYVFALLRFLTGIGCNAGQIKLIVVEIVGPTWRAFASIVMDIMYSLGEMVLGGLAFYIRDWRTLQLVGSVPAVLCLLYPFVLPESVRWLHAKGKNDKTMRSLRRMSSSNHVNFPETLTITKDPTPRRVTSDLMPFFKSPTLLFRWMINIYSWFVSNVLYIGLSYNVGTLGGNVYVNFILCAITELVAQLGCLFISSRLRRKALALTLLSTAGVLCGITVVTTLYMDTVKWYWILAATTITARMCGSAVATLLFIYTSELFPTSMRSFFVSTGNVSCFMGGMVAPYVAYMGETVDVSYSTVLPPVVYGSMATLAALLTLNLPETLNKPMPQTMSDLTNPIKDTKDDPIKDKKDDPDVWSTKL